MNDNVFTPKLVDIIVPMEQDEDGQTTFTDMFFIMDYHSKNLSNIFEIVKADSFTMDHVLTIIYNLLCSINYLHSTDVWHRDIKPQNILLTK